MSIEFNYKNLTNMVMNLSLIESEKIGTVFVKNIPNHKELVKQAGIAHSKTGSKVVIFADLNKCDDSQLNVIIAGFKGETHYKMIVGYVENSQDAHFKITDVIEK